ncbi:Uncharacterized protein SCG7109_BF_00050 [Chlamydiales bacterium SCGC AG-110-M15]|nr:Uncharacterized protein SCG7109_BF_00050 [Chlamydiales bacterium SCGC AG-110-M15]
MPVMQIDEVKKVLEDLYDGVKGTIISCSERSRENITSSTYVYGEAELHSIEKIFQIVDPQPDEVFVDLGAGVGKQVLTAALLYDFKKVRGIEILSDLHKTSKDILEQFRKKYGSKLPDGKEMPDIDFLKGNFLRADFSEADVAYMCSTCYSEEMMEGIARGAEHMKPGSRVVTLTKPLPSDQYEEIHHEFYPMSWGTSQVFIYKKKDINEEK